MRSNKINKQIKKELRDLIKLHGAHLLGGKLVRQQLVALPECAFRRASPRPDVAVCQHRAEALTVHVGLVGPGRFFF